MIMIDSIPCLIFSIKGVVWR